MKETLEKVKALIEAGWCKEVFIKFIDGKPHYCLMGAFSHSSINVNDRWETADYLRSIAGVTLINFNDECENKEQVIALINKGIEKLGDANEEV